MNPLDFSMLQNQIIDWYENLNDSNTVDTTNMRTRIPPFLRYTDNNGYIYEPNNGNIITFNREQQSVISELINDEIENLNRIRNNAQQRQTSNYLNMGGRKRTSKRRRNKKRTNKRRRNKRRSKYLLH
jgi:hypothetical protein